MEGEKAAPVLLALLVLRLQIRVLLQGELELLQWGSSSEVTSWQAVYFFQILLSFLATFFPGFSLLTLFKKKKKTL